MAIATYVVEFDGSSPAVGANTEILGGKLIGVQFNDALAEIERLEAQLEKAMEQINRGESGMRVPGLC